MVHHERSRPGSLEMRFRTWRFSIIRLQVAVRLSLNFEGVNKKVIFHTLFLLDFRS